MSAFEFLFTLYSLILGLALTEILSGLGRALELRMARKDEAEFTIGWLTPLLAVFVILDLLSFWVAAWGVREQIAVSPAVMFGIVLFCCAYFLAARMVFPSEPERFADLDNHYFRVRRLVMGILIALIAAQWAFYATIPAISAAAFQPFPIAMTVLLVAMMAATLVFRKEWINGALLVLLSARYIYLYLA